jgi:hypothetical protein
MSKHELAIYHNQTEVLFEYRTAARMARVSEEFICICEDEDLITSQAMFHGEKGLSVSDIRKLKFIRHLHEDMGLELESVDLIVRYHNQIKILQRRLVEMEQYLQRIEREHQAEIQALRKGK